jgi:transcriptional regulator with XRE-family HTH domain
MTNTAKAIKAALKRKGLKQRDIADIIGGRGHTSEVCNGTRAVPRRSMIALSRLLDVPLEKLLDEAKRPTKEGT